MRTLKLLLPLFLLTLFAGPSYSAVSYFHGYGYCEQGGHQVFTIGVLPSTTKVQESYPFCTVTVYVTGTTTKALLYSDSGGTIPLSNPFVADAHGFYTFYTTLGIYDEKFSGSTIQIPFTIGGVAFGDASLTFPLPVVQGGTGTANPGVGVVIANGTAPFTTENPLSIPHGGTGVNSIPPGILVGNNTSPITALNLTTVPQNVKNYGAAGNGSTDDTTAIRAAITATCASGNRALYFPASTGTYVHSGEFIIPCSMNIYGDGPGSSVVFSKAGSMVSGSFIVQAKNVAFSNLTIDGNQNNLGCGYRMPQWSSANTYAKFNGVFDAATFATYVAVQAVPGGIAITNATYWLPVLTGLTAGEIARFVLNASGIGIQFEQDNGSVTNVEVKNEANWGVTVNSANAPGTHVNHILLQNSYIHDIGAPTQGSNNNQAGIENYNGTLSDLRVINNKFENIYSPTYGPTASSAIFTVDASNVQLIGNTVINCLNIEGGTVSADGSGSLPYPSNVLIKNNIILQSVYQNDDRTSCIEEDAVNHVVIDGNICTGAAFDGAHMGGLTSGTQATDFVVTNNYFSVTPTLHPGTYVVAIGFPSDATTGGVTRAVVSNNIIDGGGLAGYGFNVSLPSSGVFGRGNKVFNTTIGAVEDFSSIANILMDDSNSWTGGTTAAVSNTASLVKMYGAGAKQIPNGMLQYSGATVDIKGGGIYSSIASPGNVTFNLYLGSSAVCVFGAPPIPASSTNLSYSFSAQFLFTNNTVVCSHGLLSFNGPSAGSTTAAISTTTNPISPNNAYAIDVGIQMSVANPGNSFQGKQMSWVVNYPTQTTLP